MPMVLSMGPAEIESDCCGEGPKNLSPDMICHHQPDGARRGPMAHEKPASNLPMAGNPAQDIVNVAHEKPASTFPCTVSPC